MIPVPVLSTEELDARRKRIRATTLKLVLFALAVHVAFIIAFINR